MAGLKRPSEQNSPAAAAPQAHHAAALRGPRGQPPATISARASNPG